jgi:ATP-dependent helicase YprA (DUF1998 family)
LYARVSTDDQAREGYSIPAQLKRLNALCKAKGWTVCSEYVDDGYSGRDINRPQYQRMMAERLLVGEALIGIANVLVEVAPFYVMCDTQDIGTVVDSNCLGRDALFLYDRYPGGMGYARRCLECVGEMMETVQTVIRECACEDGCPSCVGAAVPAFAMTDLDSAVRGRIPNKAAARYLLDALLKMREP